MDDEIVVSVIVPIYNVGRYFPKCIQSICNQSYPNLEIILVDDGSTDDSGSICDEYADRDKRIKVIHKKNEGLVRARKAGFLASTGKLIANIDGDDWIEPEMISNCVKIYNDTQADFIQNGFVCEGNKTDRIQYKNSVDLLTEQNVAYHITKWLDGNDYTYGSQLVTKIMKRSIFEISYFKVADNFNNGEDFISFLYYMYYGKKAVTTDKVYYHYIVHDESLSHKKNGARQLLVEDKLTEQVVHILDELSMNISGKIIKKWIIRRKGYALMQQIPEFKFYLINYQFQNIEMLLYKNIVIYGAGKVGQDLFRQISLYKNINIVGWLDKNPQKYNFTFQKVYDIGHLKNIHYDFIIIAVKQKELAEQIRADLFQIGVPDNVIVWQKYRSLLD